VTIPTPYEISRIAIALRGRAATKEPVESVREALGLWFVAAHELEEAKNKKDAFEGVEAYSGSEAASRLFEESLNKDSDWIELERRKTHPEIKFGTSAENSQAMKWLSQNGKEFKTFKGFVKAWEKIFGPEGHKLRARCTEGALNRFIAMGHEADRKSDAERKRRKRAENVSNKSEKIARGQSPPVKRTPR